MLLLPVGVWTVVFLALFNGRRPAREAALAAASVVGLAVLVFTQVLSLFHGLVIQWLVVCWVLLVAALAATLRSRVAAGSRRLASLIPDPWGRWEWVTVVVLGGFAVGTLLSALLYPITNVDSLAYHMPRVIFWFQNHSVARYATPEGRDLFASPFAEYLILQVKILAGGTDRLSNLVQWASYVLSVMTVSLIALRLGAQRRGQQVAAIAAAATPMAILQASTTQNDLTCALWCLATVYWVVSYVDQKPSGRGATAGWVLWLATALALAIQTKPTAYLVCAPFLVWLALLAVRREGPRRAAGLAALVVAIVLALGASWYVDNARLLRGDILAVNAPGGNSGLLIQDRSPSAVLTNALKNSSMMLGTASAEANSAIAQAVRGVVSVYGGDTENPRTMDRNMPGPYMLDPRIIYHDVGPSPMIVMLIVAAALVLLVSRKQATGRAKWYLLCAGAALFLTAGFIGYSYYMNRVLVGCLLILVPMVGVSTDILIRERFKTARALMLGGLALSIVWGTVVMLFNSTNRLVPPSLTPIKIGQRDLGYWDTAYGDISFREHSPQLEQPYKAIAEIVRRKGFTRVGIDSHGSAPLIYLLLALLPDRRVQYVGQTLLMDKIPQPAFTPEVVLEIVPRDANDPTLPDPWSRGAILYGPSPVLDWVLTLYRTP